MKSYILTEREREVITRFLETGEKEKSFYIYVHRAKRYYPQLAEDLELIVKILNPIIQ